MNVYKPPESDVAVEAGLPDRPRWLLVLAHLYFWPKLLHFVLILTIALSIQDWERALRFSINVPIYLAIALYLFRKRLLHLRFWQAWTLLAIADECAMVSSESTGILGFVEQFPYYLVPLYGLAVLYAFFSNDIWRRDR